MLRINIIKYSFFQWACEAIFLGAQEHFKIRVMYRLLTESIDVNVTELPENITWITLCRFLALKKSFHAVIDATCNLLVYPETLSLCGRQVIWPYCTNMPVGQQHRLWVVHFRVFLVKCDQALIIYTVWALLLDRNFYLRCKWTVLKLADSTVVELNALFDR